MRAEESGVFEGKSILVTGGAGSFGKHFVRTLLAKSAFKRLILFSRDEGKHFDMQSEFSDPRLRFFIGDVRDVVRLRQAMRDVDYVIHAAALKQVPAAEYNPMECIKTNVYGAENVIAAAIETGVERVIALSTDKAANPVNLYGATKLCSDKLFVAANNVAGGRRTRFAVVRYGNVVGSRGSVVPYFRKLIAEGATELPITDMRMTRFWITLTQGVEFVTAAFARMRGGEIFVPKIPSMRITDLAESIAPGMKRVEVGVRPGEKLHEVMCPGDDAHLVVEFSRHFVIRPSIRFIESVDYFEDAFEGRGTAAPDGFEYNSGTNPNFLSVAELRELNEAVA
jgi:UDP-N-acetylglucosamine 4,6-dehydratase